ncbi:hypothetical protein K431DRAFT_275394 [Polychaeton citri CBS 116435]|uniref:Uncharacterized protein n=1 Tax=Polychaeton citri CBS 116435 TaxID=1314669 RepID=A0A9P4UMB5_9PEZI|nr:hypothetical protein K431DRAFT_275394 [Polychaeton citri CBS 116435]
MNQQLHWTQRIALVRHNLHCASRSRDFTFFKTLQAAGLMEGTNHVATLSASLGDEADSLLAAMDDLNAGLAYIHQDAFQNVYDSLKNCIRSTENDDKEQKACRSRIYVDTAMQKNMADMAIDKMTSSAVTLINQQPIHIQEEAANVWITGITIVADSIEISLRQMDSLEDKCEDFIRLEDSWDSVRSAIAFSIIALKGVFNLMGNSANNDNRTTKANSVTSLPGNWMRKLSTTFSGSSGLVSGTSSRTSSISSQASTAPSFPQYRTPQYYRLSVSNGCPISMPEKPVFFDHHKLSTIPPTPAAEDDEHDPFDTSVPPPVVTDVDHAKLTPVSNDPLAVNPSHWCGVAL